MRKPVNDRFDAVVWVRPDQSLPQVAWATAKQTYRIADGALSSISAEPLSADLRDEELEPRWPPGSDFWPFKVGADVVVLGKAYGPGGRAVSERQVSLRVDAARKTIDVLGRRYLEWTSDALPRIGRPQPFSEMLLAYTNAYGGVDLRAPVDRPTHIGETLRRLDDHPGAYPRNQSGKGYVVVDAPADGIELPNLEDPRHRLTAENILVRDPAAWARQPLPWFLDWHYPAMFPRASFLGIHPWFPLAPEVPLWEVERGLLPERWREMATDIAAGAPPPPIYFQEASLGMSFHDLKEGTPIEVVGMHPERDRMTFTLPRFPTLEIEVEGDRQAVQAKILHVVITPHEEKVEITWAGIRDALPRAFFPGIHGQIPITLWVDGTPVPFETPEPIYEKLKRAEAEGLLEVRPPRRRPGEPGYSEVMGELLPEARADRTRDQIAAADAPRLGPIDLAAGRLLLEETDWSLHGHVPFAFRRFYSSSMTWRAGVLGLGWSHCLEQAVWEQDGWILYRMEDGREIGVPLSGGELGLGATVHHPNAGVTIHRLASDAFAVRLADGRRFGFTRVDEAIVVGAARARLTELYGPDGATLSVRYDAHGRLDRMLVPGGNYVRFEHDERGRLTRVFAPTSAGQSNAVAAAFTVDTSGQLTEALDATGRKTTYTYRGRRLAARTPPSGERAQFVYDGVGVAARCAGEHFGEHQREALWSPDRRVAGLVTATGHSRSIEVDERFGVVRALDHFANDTTRDLDEASGLVSSMTTLDGETTYLYDAHYHLADVSAPDQGSVVFEHDAEGRLTSLRDPDGHTETAHWDSVGRLAARTDRCGASVVYEYDGEGPLASILTPAELKLFLERDVTGKAIVAVRSPVGERRAERDALGRVVGVTDEVGAAHRFGYDPCGRIKEHRGPADVRVTGASDPDGRLTSWSDGARALELERDDHGRLTHVDEGGGEGMRLHRDAEGRVSMVESENFDYWELTRDAAGRVIEESGFAGEEQRALRDHRGLVRRAIRGRSRTTVTRDAAGRPTALEHSDESFQRFQWTPGGRLARAQDADRVTTFARDGEGRLRLEKNDAAELTSRYDANGGRVALDSSRGLALRIERDALGHAMKLVATQGPQRLELSFVRDAAGREKRRLLPGGLELRWGRDPQGRAVRRAVCFGDKELSTLDMTYAGLHRLVRVHDSQRGTRAMTHDARGRLVRVGELLRSLDAVGRVFRNTERDDHTYEGVRLVESYGTRYEHDDAGRRVARTNVMDETTRYVWDGGGRLVRIHLADGDRISYDYDGLGRLASRRREAHVEIPGLDEPVWEATSETELVWDGLAVLHEIEGARITTWIREGGQLMGKLSTEGAWAVLTDPAGAVTELTDAKGNLAWRGSIDAFGAATLDAADTACPWRLPGHWEDPDTGLAHSWLRVYDPDTGSYLTPNPLGVIAGSDLYGYLPDPVSETSPLGLGRGYATFGGEVRSERLEAELVERFVRALDRRDGAAGPRERFDPSAARWRLPDPEAFLFGPWESLRPSRRMPPPSSIYTRLPKHLGLSSDDGLVGDDT